MFLYVFMADNWHKYTDRSEIYCLVQKTWMDTHQGANSYVIYAHTVHP